jgi:hypothetical protein
MLRRINTEVTEGWKSPHKEFNNFYSSPYTIRIIKTRMR